MAPAFINVRKDSQKITMQKDLPYNINCLNINLHKLFIEENRG